MCCGFQLPNPKTRDSANNCIVLGLLNTIMPGSGLFLYGFVESGNYATSTLGFLQMLAGIASTHRWIVDGGFYAHLTTSYKQINFALGLIFLFWGAISGLIVLVRGLKYRDTLPLHYSAAYPQQPLAGAVNGVLNAPFTSDYPPIYGATQQQPGQQEYILGLGKQQ